MLMLAALLLSLQPASQAQASTQQRVPAEVSIVAYHATGHRAVVHTYRVEPGDSLSLIAQRYHTTWRHLWMLNRALIHDPNIILVGWVIRVSGTADPPAHAPAHFTAVAVGGCPSGNLSWVQLMALWDCAGGARWAAATAACIATHESGGQQYATGAAGERGYWQIHPDHGPLSTYNAYGNAKAAIIISGDGTNWSPWTTAPMCGV